MPFRTADKAIAAMPAAYASMPRRAQRQLVRALHLTGCGASSWRQLLGLSAGQARALIAELGLPPRVRPPQPSPQ
jgi:hypothetical protein